MIGETIGNFKIVARLGRGGMGEVYAGEHEKIQTRVAVKVLHSEISRDQEHCQRFFNEAKIVGRIKHSGIVKIFDVGFYKDHAYLIMELLEGEPLATRIAKHTRLGPIEAADYARQVASVLDATHRAGVIHRDLKPDNIFLVPDHELATGERVKILDFGISKLTGTLASGSPRTVGTMGTPAYMAPEQWGDSGNVDWRADVYSLGCAAFEMVTGRPPFVVNTIAEACAKHLTAIPPRASTFVELPPAFDELLARLLAKEPAERAVSMTQVTREFEAIATGRSIDVGGEVMARRDSQPVRPSTAPSQPFSSTPTMTTLGGSAAQLEEVQPRRRSPALFAGVIAAAAVVTVVVLVIANGSGNEQKAATPPEAVPAATPTTVTPPAAPTPPVVIEAPKLPAPVEKVEAKVDVPKIDVPKVEPKTEAKIDPKVDTKRTRPPRTKTTKTDPKTQASEKFEGPVTTPPKQDPPKQDPPKQDPPKQDPPKKDDMGGRE